jgi:hypothetical protein
LKVENGGKRILVMRYANKQLKNKINKPEIVHCPQGNLINRTNDDQ